LRRNNEQRLSHDELGHGESTRLVVEGPPGDVARPARHDGEMAFHGGATGPYGEVMASGAAAAPRAAATPRCGVETRRPDVETGSDCVVTGRHVGRGTGWQFDETGG